MIPYIDLLYFGISLYVIIPALIIGFFKRGWRVWLVIATAVMLVLQYTHTREIFGSAISELLLLLVYAIVQWFVAAGFLALRAKGQNRAALYAALFFNLLPLLAAKLIPIFEPEYRSEERR